MLPSCSDWVNDKLAGYTWHSDDAIRCSGVCDPPQASHGFLISFGFLRLALSVVVAGVLETKRREWDLRSHPQICLEYDQNDQRKPV